MSIKKTSTHITNINIIVRFFLIFILNTILISSNVHALEFEINEELFVLGDFYTGTIIAVNNENQKTNTHTVVDLLLINSLIEMSNRQEINMEDVIDKEPLVNHIRNLIYYDKDYARESLINYFSEDRLLAEIQKSYIYNKMADTNIYSLKDINKNLMEFEYDHKNITNETTLRDTFILASYMFKENKVFNNLFEQKGYYSKKDEVYVKNQLPKDLSQNIRTLCVEKNENGNFNYILKYLNLIYVINDKKDFEDACNSLMEKEPQNYQMKREKYDEKFFNISKIPFINNKASVCENIYLPSGYNWKKKIIIDKNYKTNNIKSNEYIGYLNLYNKHYSYFYPLKKWG